MCTGPESRGTSACCEPLIAKDYNVHGGGEFYDDDDNYEDAIIMRPRVFESGGGGFLRRLIPAINTDLLCNLPFNEVRPFSLLLYLLPLLLLFVMCFFFPLYILVYKRMWAHCLNKNEFSFYFSFFCLFFFLFLA